MDTIMNWKENARNASRSLNLLSDEVICEVLNNLADTAINESNYIIQENAKDLAMMDKSNPMYDRLLLSKDRLNGIAADIRNVASLHSPLGRIIDEIERPNGMAIKRITVPFGVVGIIYEARPNVSFDVFALCFKSGNACVLKGGTDAYNSNLAIVNIIKSVLNKHKLDENIVTLLSAGRESGSELMNAVGAVDVIIPRGGKGLIEFVRDNSRIPVIETGAGICHTYFDLSGDLEKGKNIITNAKTRRVSVCNALDCLIINKERLKDLPELCVDLAKKNVTILADEAAFSVLKGNYPESQLETSNPDSYGIEFLDYKMSIKTVDTINDAISHINNYGSQHSECIITEDNTCAKLFEKSVDAACVYTNVSTAFTDGAQFGLGAEIGISTQKLHARGPMALAELCSYKWLITGNGQTRL
jgi:glutamate-5-semialdehyde dehydrogenase